MTKPELAPKGLQGVFVEKTRLSKVDGAAGTLIYAGYDIDEAAKCTYEEICHLFLEGRLPNKTELASFEKYLSSERDVSTRVVDYIFSAPKEAASMAVYRTAVSMLSEELASAEGMDAADLKKNAVALVSKGAIVAAMIGRARNGGTPVLAKKELSLAANFLYVLNGKEPDPVVARTLDVALVLHADHSFNASTFTARVVASSLTDMVSAVTAAIGSLKGPLHGGANTAVMHMLLEIGDLESVEPYVKKKLAEKAKIMGFGHRVYKVIDPRAKHLKRMSKEWGERMGQVKWFDMSTKMEEIMEAEKGLRPNVDFYSASTYYAMGINPDMFTMIFAVARMVGWCAHVIEQLSDNKIMRPAALYEGEIGLKYLPIEKR